MKKIILDIQSVHNIQYLMWDLGGSDTNSLSEVSEETAISEKHKAHPRQNTVQNIIIITKEKAMR